MEINEGGLSDVEGRILKEVSMVAGGDGCCLDRKRTNGC